MKKLFFLIVFCHLTFALNINSKMISKIERNQNISNNFAFAVMGDNRDGDNVLEKIIRKIDKDKSIKFALNNGDLVPDGYQKEFMKYIKIINSSQKPIISIIGNHEWLWYDSESNYKKFFGKSYFSFSYKKSYFIILDDSNEKGISRKQTKWLIKQLKISQKYKNRFVFMHVPLFDPRKGKYKKGHSIKKINNAKELNDIFDKYKVTMLFCSHIHFYFRGKWHNTPFIITGGAGAPLKQYKNDGFYHYIKVIINDNHVEYKVLKIDAKAPSFIDSIICSIEDILNLK